MQAFHAVARYMMFLSMVLFSLLAAPIVGIWLTAVMIKTTAGFAWDRLMNKYDPYQPKTKQ